MSDGPEDYALRTMQIIARGNLSAANSRAVEYGVGFTREDVATLREMADSDDSEQESGRADLTPTLRTLADRIEALLPPEEPKV